MSEKGPAVADDTVAHEGRQARHGADLEHALVDADLREPGDPMQGNESIGRDEAQAHGGNEGGAPRDDPGLPIQAGQDLDGLGNGLGLDEREGAQAHQRGPAAASTASTIFV